jgi:hypothetical protein
VVWNVRKVLDREAPHFDPRQVGVTGDAACPRCAAPRRSTT